MQNEIPPEEEKQPTGAIHEQQAIAVDMTMPSLSSLKDAGMQDLSKSGAENSLIGELIEQYRIVQVLGKGGMSVVYKAVHSILNNTVAIKLMHSHLVSESQAVLRFKQEAQAATQLDHPNVIKVIGFGIASGDTPQPYIIMDYIEGHSLSEVLKEKGRLSVASTLKIFIQICNALAHAHNKGVIHRDLKPSNIMLLEKDGDNEFVKIVDFGIAKLLSVEGEHAHRLTQTGDVFGSPLYMSPEQCMGRTVDKRSDVYALGCVLYESLAGKPPHQGNNVFETFHKHISEIPASLQIPGADKSLVNHLDNIVFRALEKDPEKRYQTMSQFEKDLLAIQEDLDSGVRGADAGALIARQQRAIRRFVRKAPKTAVLFFLLIVMASTVIGGVWSKCAWFTESHNFEMPDTAWLKFRVPRYPKSRKSESEKREILDQELSALNWGSIRNPTDTRYLQKMWAQMAEVCAKLDAPAQEIEARSKVINFFSPLGRLRDPEYGLQAGQLGECLLAQGDYKGAMKWLKDAVLIRETHGSDVSEMKDPRANLNLGIAYAKTNNLADAKAELSEAALILTQNNDLQNRTIADGRELALIFAEQGDVSVMENKWSNADIAYNKAQDALRAITSSKKTEAFINQLTLARAFVNLKYGDYKDSAIFFEAAMPYVNQNYQNVQLQTIFNAYAYAVWNTGNYFKAIQLRDKADSLSSSAH